MAGVAGLAERTADEIRAVVDEYDVVVASSSFQTQSLPLLHMLAAIGSVPVYFLDTGFHFPETLRFRDLVTATLGLEVVSIRSQTPKTQQRASDGRLMFASDPDHCCQMNKTSPMEEVAAKSDVWITGVRRDQSRQRSRLDPMMPGPGRSQRFHPMLDWSERDVWNYVRLHQLPRHELDVIGYSSIGCAPCTRRPLSTDGGDAREDRWFGMAKTECGLHTDLVVDTKAD